MLIIFIVAVVFRCRGRPHRHDRCRLRACRIRRGRRCRHRYRDRRETQTHNHIKSQSTAPRCYAQLAAAAQVGDGLAVCHYLGYADSDHVVEARAQRICCVSRKRLHMFMATLRWRARGHMLICIVPPFSVDSRIVGITMR